MPFQKFNPVVGMLKMCRKNGTAACRRLFQTTPHKEINSLLLFPYHDRGIYLCRPKISQPTQGNFCGNSHN